MTSHGTLGAKARESSPSLIFEARVPVPKVVAKVLGLVGEQPSDTKEESQDENKELGNPGRRGTSCGGLVKA